MHNDILYYVCDIGVTSATEWVKNNKNTSWTWKKFGKEININQKLKELKTNIEKVIKDIPKENYENI